MVSSLDEDAEMSHLLNGVVEKSLKSLWPLLRAEAVSWPPRQTLVAASCVHEEAMGEAFEENC